MIKNFKFVCLVAILFNFFNTINCMENRENKLFSSNKRKIAQDTDSTENKISKKSRLSSLGYSDLLPEIKGKIASFLPLKDFCSLLQTNKSNYYLINDNSFRSAAELFSSNLFGQKFKFDLSNPKLNIYFAKFVDFVKKNKIKPFVEIENYNYFELSSILYLLPDNSRLVLSVNKSETLEMILENENSLKIVSLDLSENSFSKNNIKRLSNCEYLTNLESLDLSENDLSEEGMRALAECKNFQKLDTLKLNATALSPNDIKIIGRSDCFKNIKNLEISENYWDSDDIAGIIDSDLFVNLEYLDISHNDFNFDSIKPLLFDEKFKKLKKIKIDGNFEANGEDNIENFVQEINENNTNKIEMTRNDRWIQFLEKNNFYEKLFFSLLIICSCKQ